MNFNLEQLQLIHPENIWFDFSALNIENNGLASMNFTNATAYNNAKINKLCLTVFRKWLEDNYCLSDTQLNVPKIDNLVTIWDAINGTAITLDGTKIILIPSEVLDTEEVVISQELVDIPNLFGHYYLPIQIDCPSQSARIWGYATHQVIKRQGEYDPIYRTYSLARDYIIEDLETLWLAIDCGLQEIETIPSVAKLETDTAEHLIEKLSKPSPYSSRLEVAFEQWAALFGDRNLRQQLYQIKLANSTKIAAEKHNITTKITNLTKWLDEQFTESIESGWHSIDRLLFNSQRQLAYRSVSSLQSINQVKRGKLIRLDMQFESVEVVLLVAVTSETEDKVKVLIQLHPNLDDRYLPSNLTLSILSEGKVMSEPIVSQEDSVCIQSKPFRCSSNTDFTVNISLGETSIDEEFTIA